MTKDHPHLGKQRWCYESDWKYSLDYKKKREEMLKKQEEEKENAEKAAHQMDELAIPEESTQKEKTSGNLEM